MTKEEMLGILTQVGICPRNKEMQAAILCEAKEQGWESLLDAAIALGDYHYNPSAEYENQFQNYSDDIFHFDVECIEDCGDYVRIAERIQAMARPYLDHLSFSDEIDIDEKIAIFYINNGDAEVMHSLTVDDDWFDPKFMDIMVNELTKTSSIKEIAVLKQSLGQDTLIICKTPQQLEEIATKTGLEFTSELKQLGGQEGFAERLLLRLLKWIKK